MSCPVMKRKAARLAGPVCMAMGVAIQALVAQEPRSRRRFTSRQIRLARGMYLDLLTTFLPQPWCIVRNVAALVGLSHFTVKERLRFFRTQKADPEIAARYQRARKECEVMG